MTGKTKTSGKDQDLWQEQDQQQDQVSLQDQVIWQDQDNMVYYYILLIGWLSWHYSVVQYSKL